ncbi:MAG TPA: class I SAM-dependent methyltransferase [Burkholderiaceae bacterium]|nr:class I SAM-dependent methyltransferase [Burkholderiaceae bacterium]
MGFVDVSSRVDRAAGAKAPSGGARLLADAWSRRGGVPLRIVFPDQSAVDLGQPTRVTLRIRDRSLLPGLAAPTLEFLGDAFIDGKLDIEGDLVEAMAIGQSVVEACGFSVAQRAMQAWRLHRRGDDRAAIQHHYDVGNEFYQLWLDQRMVYSCAYFRTGRESIDEAQVAKLDHICRKLRLNQGERLLDVGCGWGALVLHAARHYGVSAVGITLSEAQAELARERVAEAGLSGRVEILLMDYRDLPNRFGVAAFDKVASVGMFEHVGLRNLPAYFRAVAAVLRDRGLFLNHGITASDVESRSVGSGVSEFMERHVFPHSELPHLHVAVREISAAGFETVDVESLRPHYAQTLAQWYRRLEERGADAVRLVPARTLRTWRIYLAGCSYAFQQGWMNVYQILTCINRSPGLTDLPLTRDWMYA